MLLDAQYMPATVEPDSVRDARVAKWKAEREIQQAARAAFEVEAAARMPAWAKAVIVAELVKDESDLMSDYHGSTTTRTVILAFSKHERDLFPELRKAALNFAETESLATAPSDAEHRQKYSMGGGYFLKAGYRHDSGWTIQKRRLYQNSISGIPTGEWSLEKPKATTATGDVAAPMGATIQEHTHTKKGFQMFIVVSPLRVSREAFDSLCIKAKEFGGWYSQKWGTSPGGFAFKSLESAESFLNMRAPGNGATESATVAAPRAGLSDKLRDIADKMQKDIDSKFADRLTNTPKRNKQAAMARREGSRLKLTQAALRAIAGARDAGTLPAVLESVTSKAATFELMRTVIDTSNAGYYDAGRDTGEPALNTPQAIALWGLVGGKSESEKNAELLQEAINKLQFANIAGYFPTPAALVAQMIERADIADGMKILEPSAGSGNILDLIRADFPGCTFGVYEWNFSLRGILARKGYAVTGDDFTQVSESPSYDRVLMNPPFEKGQDMAHVRRAFDLLKEGGRLLAIMSPGPFFRQDSACVSFRDWFDNLGGEKTDIAAGAFKESGTGVASVMVEIRK